MGWGSRLALLLLILNLVVLGTGWALERYRQSERYLPGYNMDKIQLTRSPADGATAGKGGSRRTAADTDTAGPPTADASSDIRACLVLDKYDQGVHESLRDELAGAGLVPGDYDLRLAKNLGWWVYLPPEANAARRQEMVDRLRELGITDLAVIGRGSMTNAISLGMFADAGQARAHLGKIKALGVEGAVFGPRPDSGPARLNLSALSAGRRAGLPAGLRGRLQACP